MPLACTSFKDLFVNIQRGLESNKISDSLHNTFNLGIASSELVAYVAVLGNPSVDIFDSALIQKEFESQYQMNRVLQNIVFSDGELERLALRYSLLLYCEDLPVVIIAV